ncbi:hypothetical protein TVAG_410980 [Trichomonas vaginalis G3]|uniref:Exportin-1/Importin-beta-like domain-containing protein n=1 Tax=Trichomonas vaginalis (strain ATCC PRA-98 / G3) TaxID=412133 RepID=A2DXK3_TRIV3|nr:armadillo (ARM) repeat-containing protein family [Trichomonas vaginalis G3]EAY14832.1 hypothetical protein TVAG_410980 [Trichomonas vaginalis G3]KAI5541187.1 armadillo (ARM) repeat-containing protein family [Trichomonas vaginalis G3]|eukprot:XP_001327055.1 hypothetical protein [Trichomonas vaginalis G3]
MNLRDAILSLYSQDPSEYNQAFLVCKDFQTPTGFDFQEFCQLVSPELDFQFRNFGYNSLKVILMQYWKDISPELQQLITNCFPFYQNTDESDPFASIICHTTSIFLLFCASDDLLNQYFSSYDNFWNEVVLNFLIELGSVPNSYQRTNCLKNIYNNAHDLIFEKFILPLTSENFDSKLFEILGKIHDLESPFVTKLLSMPRVEEIYSRFAELVWIPDSLPGLISIFMSTLSSGQPCPYSANSIADSALSVIPEYYQILFATEDVEGIEEIDQYVSAFCNRIQLFFLALPKIEISKLNSMFDFITFLFSTTSPTAMHNIVKELTKSLRSPEFKTEDFFNALLEERLKIVDICSTAITIDLKSLYLNKYDYETEINDLKSSFYQLISSISEIFDSTVLCQEISQLILTKDPSSIYGLIRLLFNVIVEPNEENIEVVRNSLSNVFEFIFTNMSKIPQNVHEYAYKLLSKICPYLDLNSQQATEIFNFTLQNCFEQNSKSYDPVTVFLLDFSTAFMSVIEFPIEQMQNTPTTAKYFWVTRVILAKISVITNFDFLGESIPFAIQMMNDVDSNNLLNDINYKIGRVLEFLSYVPSDCLTESFYTQIFEILLNHLSMIVLMNDNNTFIARAFHHVNRALIHMLEFVPELSVEVLPKLTAPTELSSATELWLNETVLKVIETSFQYDPNSTSEFCNNLIIHLFKLIENSETDLINVINQVSLIICRLSSFVSDESAFEVFNAMIDNCNSRIYESIISSIKKRGFVFFTHFWSKLITRKGNKETDSLTSAIFDLIEDKNIDFSDLLQLNGVNEADLSSMRNRYLGATSSKTKKKHIKNFLLSITNTQ